MVVAVVNDECTGWAPRRRPDPLDIDTADMGFQIGLMDAVGIAAMMTSGIPR